MSCIKSLSTVFSLYKIAFNTLLIHIIAFASRFRIFCVYIKYKLIDMCLHPVPTKRRDTQGRMIYRPCGDCVECSRQQTNSWFVRLREEAKQHRYMLFVTYKYPNTFLSYKHVNFVNNGCDFFSILKKYFYEHPSKSLQKSMLILVFLFLFSRSRIFQRI